MKQRYESATDNTCLSPMDGYISCAANYFHNKSLDLDSLNSASSFSKLIMVRDGLLEISINLINVEDLQFYIHLVYIEITY